MKNLQMPHSYISVSEEELRSISGGGLQSRRRREIPRPIQAACI